MHAVARLRLARVMAAQGDAEQALAMLAEPSAAYLASYDIARGDILLAEGREAEALAAFRSAVAALGPDVPVPGTLMIEPTESESALARSATSFSTSRPARTRRSRRPADVMPALRALLTLLLLAGLAGCSTVSDFFSMDDEEDPQAPVKLEIH